MISVIVYGRNDARGYGMHKRVAMSLNTIAEVLSAPTSEILFIDYNTPNQLPTLPELIRDMLTEKARLRTRVLRVRPQIHARFAPFTPLPVLESIARNVGLRRSRPQNRWVLSTNTDTILVLPRGMTLCEVARDLPGTHYGTPRFELPERLWESLDRTDPAGIIANVRRWGDRARLNEIVRGQGAVQFDNPGDFQLVRRSVLFSIDGFDEEALLGWHIDQNLAHRLNMKCGPEGDLSDTVMLYHCSHTRQATATHSHHRLENDVQRFVHQVRAPDIPRQRDAWGCIDDHVGEIELRQPTILALTDAIEHLIAPLDGRSLTAHYTNNAFNTLWYDIGHVGVYLLDLISTFPRGTTVGLAACRRDLAQLLASGLSLLGFSEKPLVPADVAERLGVAQDDRFRVCAPEDFAREADMFVFEFGLVRDEDGEARSTEVAPQLTTQEVDALDAVAAQLSATARLERETRTKGNGERMLVAINAVHSQFEALVSECIESVPSPFTTRLRYGLVLRTETVAEPAATGGRRVAAPTIDPPAARAFVAALMQNDFQRHPTRLRLAAQASEIRKLLTEGRLLLPSHVAPAELLDRLDVVLSPPPEFKRFPHEAVGACESVPAPNAIASTRDFASSEWLAAARRVAPKTMRGRIRRDGWFWERAQLLWALLSTRGHGERSQALLVAECADDLLPPLADTFGRLDLVDVRSLLGREPPTLQRAPDFATGPHMFREKVRVVTCDEIANLTYDAIIIPHSAAFRMGLAGLAPLLGSLRGSLKERGVLAIGGEIAITGVRRGDRPDWKGAGTEGLIGALAEHAGLNPISPRPAIIDPADASLIGSQQDLDAGLPVLAIRREGEIFWPATWLFEAAGLTIDPTGLDTWLANLLLGDQQQGVVVGSTASRVEDKIVAKAGHAEGHVFFGPYLRLPEGNYLASVVVIPIAQKEGTGVVRLVAEVAIGPDIVTQQEVELDVVSWDRPVLFEMTFSMPSSWSVYGEGRPCEIRLWSNGGGSFEVRTIELAFASSHM